MVTKRNESVPFAGIVSKTVSLTDLPGGKGWKGDLLWQLPQVQAAVERVRAGVRPGKAEMVQIPQDEIVKLKITTPGRILKEKFEALIEQENLRSTTGTRLQALRRKDNAGGEFVYVSAAVEHVSRSSSIKRVRERREGKK